ncbi:unnamed protein product [Effrenium voratum]|uniref:Uncharacterized protein n=1 Tax=Effrenium voratum TaxID=2562239 RepID=A0AA36I498_9DINO|nr:unnamed protein product [Effrenium voratum]
MAVKESLPVFDLGELISMSATATPDSWSADHAARLQEETRLFYGLGTAHKMESVLRTVRKYVCAGREVEQMVHGQMEDSSLMLSVLNVLRLLQRFGFLPNLSTFQELQGPLLRILDGRTDLLNLREVELQLDVRDVKPDHFGMGSGSLSDDAVVPLLRDEEARWSDMAASRPTA